MRITSSAFANGEVIPQKYGRDFANTNPPLHFADVPAQAKSRVLVMDDPDVPAAAGVPVWDHWVVFNIPPHVAMIAEGEQPPGTPGKGTRGKTVYGGPRPPDREHRYYFKLYAIDTMLDLSAGATKQEVEEAMQGHVIAEAQLMGRYSPQTQ